MLIFAIMWQVTMVLYEVLRLYPPVTLLERATYKEMELGGIKYPPGVKLLLPVVTIHHDPDIWGEDVDEFKPERFAEGISKASKEAPAFFPFGWGHGSVAVRTSHYLRPR
jgi:cytochrome P450